MNLSRKFIQGLAALALATAVFAVHGGTAVYYIYDESGHVIGEYNSDGTPVQEHVYLDNRPVAVLQNGSTSTTDYVSTDQLDTPRIITDSGKNVVWQWNSDPYGNEQPTGSLTYNLRFPGQYFDVETGKNYNWMRDYNPATGRYTESDPIGLRGGINTYMYVLNNPLVASDKRGEVLTVLLNAISRPGNRIPEEDAEAIDNLSNYIDSHLASVYGNLLYSYLGLSDAFPASSGAMCMLRNATRSFNDPKGAVRNLCRSGVLAGSLCAADPKDIDLGDPGLTPRAPIIDHVNEERVLQDIADYSSISDQQTSGQRGP